MEYMEPLVAQAGSSPTSWVTFAVVSFAGFVVMLTGISVILRHRSKDSHR